MVGIAVSILSFMVVIAICVIIHESGHYAAAVWRKVQVHEFAFGMGPGLISKRASSGTLWSWRLFPIGGYVRMEGEEEEPRPGDTPDRTRSFNIRRPWERFIIIAGGAFMNLLLAWLLTVFLLSAHEVGNPEPVIGKLIPGRAAAEMGALPGDRVLTINGRSISKWAEIRDTLQAIGADEVEIVVRRGDGDITLTGTVPMDQELGVRLWGVEPSRITYPVHKAALVGMKYCWDLSVMQLNGLKNMIIGKIKPDIAGPVGIAVMAGNAARDGFWTFVMFLAIINLCLGVMNLLPLPALDGGRLVFLLFEIVSGRKFPERWENRIHQVGLVMLFVLIAIVTWQDILRIVNK
jgi:regulator of sigma E protease